MPEKKKIAIIIMGAPGSGKGIQANLLAERFGLYHLETSKVIEQAFQKNKDDYFVEVEGKKYYLKEEKKRWKEGELVHSPFFLSLIGEKLREIAPKGRVVFSGSPRTLEEGEKLMPLLVNLYGRENIKIFFLDIGVEDSIWRNSHRKICELMRHPILYSKETEKLKNCPLDGSKLVQRSLDNAQTIKERFRVFEKETLPVLDLLKKQGFLVATIDGKPSVSEVFSRILKFL